MGHFGSETLPLELKQQKENVATFYPININLTRVLIMMTSMIVFVLGSPGVRMFIFVTPRTLSVFETFWSASLKLEQKTM